MGGGRPSQMRVPLLEDGEDGIDLTEHFLISNTPTIERRDDEAVGFGFWELAFTEDVVVAIYVIDPDDRDAPSTLDGLTTLNVPETGVTLTVSPGCTTPRLENTCNLDPELTDLYNVEYDGNVIGPGRVRGVQRRPRPQPRDRERPGAAEPRVQRPRELGPLLCGQRRVADRGRVADRVRPLSCGPVATRFSPNVAFATRRAPSVRG